MQGEVERACKYTLHGTSVGGFTGNKNSISVKRGDPLVHGGNVTYILPANAYFTTNFEVETATGSVAITSSEEFCKLK